MKRTKGLGVWSTAIYDLVDYLQENKISNPICFFQEPAISIKFLSHDKVQYVLLGESEYYFQFFGTLPNGPQYSYKVAIIKKLMIETYEKYYFKKQEH